MGINQRKAKHKEDLRKSILDAAMELFIEQGFESTSMRNIAEKIEYSPTTIYIYFKNKNEILHALHEMGFQQLSQQFRSLMEVDHPFERLKAMGRTYIRFAKENPQLYHLMMVMFEPIAYRACIDDAEWEEGHQAYLVLYKTVESCQAKGYFKGIHAHGMSLVLWGTLHGLCTLHTSGHLEHIREIKGIEHESDSVLSLAYETFIQVLDCNR